MLSQPDYLQREDYEDAFLHVAYFKLSILQRGSRALIDTDVLWVQGQTIQHTKCMLLKATSDV